ncbi:MAG: NADPH-dependent 7-cyano-7-deazaguanine reductase QueF [Candidatus Cloacimonetes bacterium]|nr:NADPH-dependent 7-cyano-7-deazaguanine reductase QueF [Candidatus Cloacimonadota bacterium]
MNKFITQPDFHLLNPIPRKIGRENIGWDTKNIPFSGIDIWNCYEFSFLEKSGKPFIGILRIEYPADSEFLIESKSLKLYLNSFNMAVFNNFYSSKKVIINDLQNCLKTSKIKIKLVKKNIFNLQKDFKNIDNVETKNNFEYEINPNLLIAKSVKKQEYFLMSNLLKSNCPITNQPDWGTVYIYYLADKKQVMEESFLRYIVSYRNHNEFHEECCERILFDLVRKIQPKKIAVLCKYNRRGGIDINPIRIYPKEQKLTENFLSKFQKIMYSREFRQ